MSEKQGNWIGGSPGPLPARTRLWSWQVSVCESCPWPCYCSSWASHLIFLSLRPCIFTMRMHCGFHSLITGWFCWRQLRRAHLPAGVHRMLVPALPSCPRVCGAQSATLKQGLRNSTVRWLNNKMRVWPETEMWSVMEQCLHYSCISEPKLLFIYIFGKSAGRFEASGLWCVVLSVSCSLYGYLTHIECWQCCFFNSQVFPFSECPGSGGAMRHFLLSWICDKGKDSVSYYKGGRQRAFIAGFYNWQRGNL